VKHVIVDVLLAAGVVAQLICCLGLLVARTAFDRLHYAGAASTVGPLLVMASILVDDHTKAQGLNTIAAVVVMLFAGPIVVHATARAARRVHFGHAGPRPEELEGQD
jgi:multisubunit Na+/H+ antiporter MnhG subunit